MSDTGLFRKQKTASVPQVILFGFGKHPAWSEHEQNLGESSDVLLRLRDRLYWEGILKHAKTWESLSAEARCEVDHWLVWARGSSVVVGRIVASADASGRKAVPFIVVAQVNGCALDLVIRRLFPALDEFTQRCHKLPNRKAVEAAFSSEQAALESQLSNDNPAPESLGPTTAERAAFTALADWDPQGVALGRLLYKVESTWAAFAPLRDGRAPKCQAGVALRVPSAPGQVAGSVLLWEEFVNALVHRDIPRLYLVPACQDWLDLVVGDFEASHFLGLQSGRKHLGLETQVPHAVHPELLAHAQALMSAWRAGGPLPMPNREAAEGNSSDSTNFFVKSDRPETASNAVPAGAAPSRANPRRRWWIGFFLLGGLLLLGGGLRLLRSLNLNSSDPQTVSARAPSTALATGPELAAVNESPALEVGGKEQMLELALRTPTNPASLAKLRVEATVDPAERLGVRPSFSDGRWHLILIPQTAGPATLRVTATDERGQVSSPISFGVLVRAPKDP